MKNRETILIEELLINMQPKNCLEWGSGYSTFNFSRLIPSVIRGIPTATGLFLS